ncbi:hypothetical protein [Aggregatibacter sp.]
MLNSNDKPTAGRIYWNIVKAESILVLLSQNTNEDGDFIASPEILNNALVTALDFLNLAKGQAAVLSGIEMKKAVKDA